MLFTQEDIERWRELEAEVRERASREDEIPHDDDILLSRMESSARRLKDTFEALGLKKWAKMADQIMRIANSLGSSIYFDCKLNEISRKDCDPAPWIKNRFDELDELSEEAAGERCTSLHGKVEKYTLPAMLSDLASCFHKVLEMASVVSGWITGKGKCFWLKSNADPELIEACKEWENTVERFHELGLYDKDDYDYLGWLTKGDKAEVIVGSSEGNKVRIDLAKGVLEYYDLDRAVRKTMASLFENVAGLECRALERGWAIVCEGVTEDNLKDVAKVMAAATSMTFRLDEPEKYWSESELELSEYKRIRRLLERI